MAVGICFSCGHAELEFTLGMGKAFPRHFAVLICHGQISEDQTARVVERPDRFRLVLCNCIVDLIEGERETLFPQKHPGEVLENKNIVWVAPRCGLKELNLPIERAECFNDFIGAEKEFENLPVEPE